MDNQNNINNLTLSDLTDSTIISHGFVYYKRDYYFHIDTILPGEFAGQYLLLFKHCYELSYLTNLDSNILKQSWNDIYINLKQLQDNGEPDGYAWAGGLIAYPGFSIIQNSAKAKAWTEKLGQPMSELLVETDFIVNLVFQSWDQIKINKSADILSYLTFPAV